MQFINKALEIGLLDNERFINIKEITTALLDKRNQDWQVFYEIRISGKLNSIFSPNSSGYGENFCFIAPSTQIFHNFYLSFGDAVGTLYLCTVIESQKWPSSSSPRFTTTNLNPLQMKELTYADIRKMALEHGIKDTRLHIGFGLLTDTSRNEKMNSSKMYMVYPAVSQNPEQE